ncbi:hypothetical protein [Marinobacter profundi]|uniref:Uncharacterized protein n=1 Tax=Marinobacter profundi TaxID=2666256 RepID=A0A2G1UMK6_9GAMM|nr:hypothetical protein [Marinobacter profundi]PHQ15734.1 hypothetical protein CLH61_06160 [Marinobacter profundi]
MIVNHHRKCPECNEVIEKAAPGCKYCGENFRINTVYTWMVNIGTLVFVGAMMWVLISWEIGHFYDPPALVAERPSKSVTGEYYIGAIALGCVTEDVYSRAFSMMTNREWEALARVVESGQCVELPEGMRVHIEDSTFSMVRIRPAGEVTAYWTGIEVPIER